MTEGHYRSVVATMQEALLLAELIEQPGAPVDFRYLELNPAAERMLGLTRDQVIGRTGRELLPDIQEDLVELCVRVVHTGVAESRDVYEPLFQQHHRSVFFRPAPGQVAVIFTDITEHKRSEAALAAAAASLARERERLDLLVSSIDDHLVSYDREWRFTFVNDAAARLLGHPREALLGRSIWEVFPEAIGNPYDEALHTAARELRPLRMEHYYAPFERWFENHIYPSVDGVTVFASDITARKRAEAALRESEERFRVMADGLELMVWVHAADGAQEFVNQRACEFFGVARDEMRGVRWEHLVHPDDLTTYVGRFRAALVSHAPFHDVARVRRADGEWRWVESWGRPRFAGDGTFTGLVGASVDVTSRLDVERALRDADQRKDQFLATLAHELRNPLAAIRSAVDVLRMARADVRPAASAFRVLETQVTHMVRQVDDLIDISRISRGRIELRRDPTDLVRVIEQAVEALDVAARAHVRGVDVPPHPVYVNADPTRLAQVVSNLIGNALKFSGASGEIRCALSVEDGYGRLCVQDNGIGIPREHLERIFDVFTQLESPMERSRSGLGIGLSLAKALVEQHGGTITAASGGRGRGAEFTVCLPCLEPARASSSAPTAVPSTQPRSRRILVVDDNQDAADMLTMLLEAEGHSVATAYGGMHALAAMRTLQPQFVVLDIGMPGLNGFETARRMRQEHPAVRLIALTGWGEPADRQRSADAGFDAHLVKPADLAELKALLADWDEPEGRAGAPRACSGCSVTTAQSSDSQTH